MDSRRIAQFLSIFCGVICISITVGTVVHIIANFICSSSFYDICQIIFLCLLLLSIVMPFFYVFIKIMVSLNKPLFYIDSLYQSLSYIILVWVLASSFALLFSLFVFQVDEYSTAGVLLAVFCFVEMISIHSSLKIWA